MAISHLPSTIGQNLSLQVDDQTSVIYVGTAPMNSASSDAVWSIKKLNVSGGSISIQWANGNDLNINIWSNRASLSYS